jgi:hypothetical protein
VWHAPIARASGPPEAVKPTYTLIVTDASPLITLALAGELDLLLRLGTPVSISDAVFNEATRVRTAGGASAIVEWVNAHLNQLHIAPTEVGSISSAGWRRGVRLAGLVRPRRSKRWNEFSAPIPKPSRSFCS